MSTEIKAKWQKEILEIKKLGERVGYGNMMDVASSLWAISLNDKGYPTLGAFEPVIIGTINKQQSQNLSRSRERRTEEIRKLIRGK